MGQWQSDPAASLSASHAKETSLTGDECSGLLRRRPRRGDRGLHALDRGLQRIDLRLERGGRAAEGFDALEDGCRAGRRAPGRRLRQRSRRGGPRSTRGARRGRSGPAHGQFLLRDDRHHPTRGQRCHHPVRTIRGFDPGASTRPEGGSIAHVRAFDLKPARRIHLNRVTTAD